MSDSNISIVPKQSKLTDIHKKANAILNWLISNDIVKPELSECVLGTDLGYEISTGAKKVTMWPDLLPFDIITNGLSITTDRQIFDTGGNGIESVICPNCTQDISNEDFEFLNEWYEGNEDLIKCPLCKIPTDIQDYKFIPEWGFSDFGLTFWNWPQFTEEFINEIRVRINCDVNVVYVKI